MQRYAVVGLLRLLCGDKNLSRMPSVDEKLGEVRGQTTDQVKDASALISGGGWGDGERWSNSL